MQKVANPFYFIALRHEMEGYLQTVSVKTLRSFSWLKRNLNCIVKILYQWLIIEQVDRNRSKIHRSSRHCRVGCIYLLWWLYFSSKCQTSGKKVKALQTRAFPTDRGQTMMAWLQFTACLPNRNINFQSDLQAHKCAINHLVASHVVKNKSPLYPRHQKLGRLPHRRQHG